MIVQAIFGVNPGDVSAVFVEDKALYVYFCAPDPSALTNYIDRHTVTNGKYRLELQGKVCKKP